MTTDRAFAEALEVFVRAIAAYKARRPSANLLKNVWVLVHESSPRYQEAVASKPISVADGYALARGGKRSGWFDQFPKDCVACLISIGDEQKAFPLGLPKVETEDDGGDLDDELVTLGKRRDQIVGRK